MIQYTAKVYIVKSAHVDTSLPIKVNFHRLHTCSRCQTVMAMDGCTCLPLLVVVDITVVVYT